MKNRRINLLLFASVLLLIILATAYRLISEENAKQVTRPTDVCENPFTTYIKEPLVIEKEVLVYVEKETEVFNDDEVVMLQPINENFDILQPSNLSREQLIDALGTIRYGLVDVVDSVIQAEKEYGVNSLYLLSKLGFESGWGEYETGNNNIAGWKGDRGNFSDFDSRHECVMTVAEGLATSFKDDVGTSLKGVVSRYCPDYGYLNTLMQIMTELKNNVIY